MSLKSINRHKDVSKLRKERFLLVLEKEGLFGVSLSDLSARFGLSKAVIVKLKSTHKKLKENDNA